MTKIAKSAPARWALLAITMLGLLAAPAFAENTGRIVGSVVDGEEEGLPGAAVRLVGSDKVVVTDDNGRFTILQAPTGAQQLRVSYIGFEDTRVSLEVAPSGVTEATIVLVPGQMVSEILTVRAAPFLEGQAKAFTQQKNAPNIKNVIAEEEINAFPDQNSAEATQRIPGVSIERDQGEGRYVLIRGTEARLNSMKVDGERLPSPEGDVRQVALDVISSDLLQGIEVNKVLTPDMDGDAIGGSVNLILKDPPRSPEFRVQTSYGYADLEELNTESIQLSWGGMSESGKFGYQISGSYTDNDRASDNFEPAYDDGFLEEIEIRDYLVRRTRVGFQGSLDYFQDADNRYYIKGTFNEFNDQEYRRAKIQKVADGEIERELKDRFESQVIYALSFGGEHNTGRAGALDWRVTLDYAEEDEPDALYSLFLQEGVDFDPNVSPSFIDPNNIQPNPLNEDFGAFLLDELELNDNITEENNLIARVNYEQPFSGARFTGSWKAGAKYRDKSKERDNTTFVFSPDADLALLDFNDQGYGFNTSVVDGRYVVGPMPDPTAMRNLLATGAFERERDFEEETADYEADETVYSGYVMAELFLNERLMLLPGVRYEYTDTEYKAREALFDPDGEFIGLTPAAGSSSYGVVLPHLHARYEIDEQSQFRAAFTRSFARPDFEQLTPAQLILEEDNEIEAGNPDLDPTLSWNLDLLYERYFATVGVLSVGAFYKDLTDYIYFFTRDIVRDGENFDLIQPLNGDDAELLGFELAYVHHLRSLPAPFDGLGVHLNYTYTDSEAVFPERVGEKATLPGQSEDLGNIALSYEKAGFSARLSYNFHGKYIAEVGETAAEDVFYDDREQLDFIASYTLTNGLRFSLELNNLTDEPLRFYEGSENRPIQEEYYSWYGRLGVSFTF